MKVVILYRPNSEHDTLVQDFLREYRARTGKELELTSIDTKEGAEIARLYDAVDYPALIAIEDNGQLHQMWQGDRLPLIDEVSYFDNKGW